MCGSTRFPCSAGRTGHHASGDSPSRSWSQRSWPSLKLPLQRTNMDTASGVSPVQARGAGGHSTRLWRDKVRKSATSWAEESPNWPTHLSSCGNGLGRSPRPGPERHRSSVRLNGCTSDVEPLGSRGRPALASERPDALEFGECPGERGLKRGIGRNSVCQSDASFRCRTRFLRTQAFAEYLARVASSLRRSRDMKLRSPWSIGCGRGEGLGALEPPDYHRVWISNFRIRDR